MLLICFHILAIPIFALVLTATLTRALKSILQGLLLSAADERFDPIELLCAPLTGAEPLMLTDHTARPKRPFYG